MKWVMVALFSLCAGCSFSHTIIKVSANVSYEERSNLTQKATIEVTSTY